MKHLGLSDAVFDHISGLILDGTLIPGAPLRIAQLAADTGASPTPVREALARLEATGLVNRIPMRGFIVAPPLTQEDLADLTETRALLEPEIARLACEHATPDLLAGLEECQGHALAAPGGTDYAEYRPYLTASADFHRLLAEACGNPFLVRANQTLPVHMQRFRLFGVEGVTDAHVSIAEHQRVLDALIVGDAAAARTAMADHVRAVGQRAAAALVR